MSDDLNAAVRICPACLLCHYARKNGHVRGRQRYRCHCGHQFTGGMVFDVVMTANKARIREVAGRLIHLGIPVATIASATGLSLSWLYQERSKAGTIASGWQVEGGAAK